MDLGGRKLTLTPEKLVLVLRDGRKLIGVLRSWDQFGMPSHTHFGAKHGQLSGEPSACFAIWERQSHCLSYAANLVLQDTIERLYSGNLYADIPRGIFLVRGENVLLLGEIVCLLLYSLGDG